MQLSNKLIEQLVDISLKAGRAILGFYNKDLIISHKDDHSPVTEADLAAHRIIIESLNRMAPDIPVISEESGVPDYETRKQWRTFFLVDPLDGTKEFVNGHDEFTVNIALIEDNEPVFGVVHVPASGLTYFGGRGLGSWKINADETRTIVTHRKFDKKRPATIVVSRSHYSERTKLDLKSNGVRIGKQIVSGSSLKFCLVADGTADLYPRPGPTMEWDTAAGDCIYRYSCVGKPVSAGLIYNKKEMKNGGFILGLDYFHI